MSNFFKGGNNKKYLRSTYSWKNNHILLHMLTSVRMIMLYVSGFNISLGHSTGLLHIISQNCKLNFNICKMELGTIIEISDGT